MIRTETRGVRGAVSTGGLRNAVCWMILCCAATGCPAPPATPIRPAPTPRTSIPPPKIEARANPVFRLIVGKRSADEPARLIVLSLRIENIHDQPLSIQPDRVRLELPDGSSRAALDRSRAAAILEQTRLARADLYYLDSDTPIPSGGLTRTARRRSATAVRKGLLVNTRLAAGESCEGFVIVDTRRRFRSLDTAVVEVVATATEPGPSTRYPVRVLLGAPIELAK